MKIILGSKSPRRKELLEMLGYQFLIHPSEVNEDVITSKPSSMVLEIARKKAHAIVSQFPNDLIICADTIVVCNNEILGKPRDQLDAKRMISLLQNNTHQVMTAVVCIYQNHVEEFVEKTKVYITKMDEDEIDEYVKTSEPYDKAGGYAIQGIFGKYIEKIEGDFYNVVGLPICKLHKIIKEMKKNSNC